MSIFYKIYKEEYQVERFRMYLYIMIACQIMIYYLRDIFSDYHRYYTGAQILTYIGYVVILFLLKQNHSHKINLFDRIFLGLFTGITFQFLHEYILGRGMLCFEQLWAKPLE